MNPLLADIVLIVHFAFVAFVVGGLALVWIGAVLGWAWVRNFWFRAAHLAAIAFRRRRSPAGSLVPADRVGGRTARRARGEEFRRALDPPRDVLRFPGVGVHPCLRAVRPRRRGDVVVDTPKEKGRMTRPFDSGG
jgi:hypothetical protein